MKRTVLWVSGWAALSLLLPATALADELLRFKSGYEMMVVSHREDRGMIVVTLEGGGEVGFPKDSLELLETGKPTQRIGPTPRYNRMPPPRARSVEDLRVHVAPGQTRALNVQTSSKATRVGYSMNGEGQMRFGAGAQGEMSGGKIGTDFRVRGPRPGNVAPGQKQRGPKEVLPSVSAETGIED